MKRNVRQSSHTSTVVNIPGLKKDVGAKQSNSAQFDIALSKNQLHQNNETILFSDQAPILQRIDQKRRQPVAAHVIRSSNLFHGGAHMLISNFLKAIF